MGLKTDFMGTDPYFRYKLGPGSTCWNKSFGIKSPIFKKKKKGAPTLTSGRNWDQVPCFEKLNGIRIKLPRMQIKVLGSCPPFSKIQFWDKLHIFKSKHLWLNSRTTQLRAQVPSHATSLVKFRAVYDVNLRIGRH